MFLKQSTAVVVNFGAFVDKTDGVTLETGLVSALDHASTGIFLSKNGGALTIRHATVTATTYGAYGMYLVTLDTTDTNTLGSLRMSFSEAATCLPVWSDFQVVPANIYDSLVSGSDLVDVSMTQILGTAVSSPATAGILDVNLKNIANAAVSTSTAQLGVNAVQAGATAWGSGAITAASIASDAITDAKVAADVTIASVTGAVGSVTGAVGSVTGAVGSVTGNVGGNVVGSVGSVTGLTAADVGAIKAKTDNLPSDPADQSLIMAGIDDLPTNAELATALGTADDAVLAAVAALNNLSAAQVNAEVVDVIRTDTISELAQGAPAATPTVATALMLLYMALRNQITVTGSSMTVSNDAGTVISKKALSDDAVTYTEAEMVTGP
jgi:hypothetical protein